MSQVPDPELTEAGYEIPFLDDPFEMHSGPYYARRGADGGLELALRVGETQCNTSRIVHGGVLMTFADLSVCLAATDGLDEMRALTVSLTSNFLGQTREGALVHAYPVVIHRTRRTAFVEAKIVNGDETVFTCTAVIRLIPRG